MLLLLHDWEHHHHHHHQLKWSWVADETIRLVFVEVVLDETLERSVMGVVEVAVTMSVKMMAMMIMMPLPGPSRLESTVSHRPFPMMAVIRRRRLGFPMESCSSILGCNRR